MTYRSFSEPGSLLITQTQSSLPGYNGGPPTSSSSMVTDGKFKEVWSKWDGGPNKGNHRSETPFWFHSLKASGLIGSSTTWNESGGYRTVERVEGVFRGVNPWHPTQGVPDFSFNDNRASQRLLTGLNGFSSGGQVTVDIPVVLGELKETLRIGNQLLDFTRDFARVLSKKQAIQNSLISLRSLTNGGSRHLRGKKARAIKRRIDTIQSTWKVRDRLAAEAWLGYSFGIRPLVNDLSALVTAKTRDTFVGPFRGSSTETVVQTASQGGYTGVWTHEMKSRWQAIGVITADSFTQHAADSGLRNAVDLIRVGWELLPLSFVADYFYNFGGYLEAVSNHAYYRDKVQLSQGKHTRLHVIHGEERISESSLSATGGSDVVAVGRCKTTFFNRHAGFSDMGAIPSPQLPQLQIPTGASQLLTCAALLRTIGLKHY